MSEANPFNPSSLGPQDDTGVCGVVVVHGLTGAPWDVLPVAHRLATAGYTVEVPLLTGHDEGAKGVGRATLAQWRNDVRQVAQDLYQRTQRPILLMGLSMGGLLSLDLAVSGDLPVAGVAAFASPLTLSKVAEKAGALAASGSWVSGLAWPKIGGPDIENKAALPGASSIPLSAVGQLSLLMDAVRQGLPSLTCPLLVMHSKHDHTAPLASARDIVTLAKSSWKRLVILTRGYHVVTRDVCSERVSDEALAFAHRVTR